MAASLSEAEFIGALDRYVAVASIRFLDTTGCPNGFTLEMSVNIAPLSLKR